MTGDVRAGERFVDPSDLPPLAIEIFRVDLDASCVALEAEEATTPRLSPDEIARFDQKSSAIGSEDARRWRCAHTALRITLERYTGASLRRIDYDAAPGGRPRLPREARLLQYPEFSLAHAGNAALIAIARNASVGVDIEVPRTLRISDERRARIVRAAMQLAPECPLPAEHDARLLQSWVRLEAIAKASGLGIGRILAEAGIIGGARKSEPSSRERPHTFDIIDLDAGHLRYAAVAAPRLPQSVAVKAFPATPVELSAFLAQARQH